MPNDIHLFSLLNETDSSKHTPNSKSNKGFTMSNFFYAFLFMSLPCLAFSESLHIECKSTNNYQRLIAKANSVTHQAVAKYWPAPGDVFPFTMIDTDRLDSSDIAEIAIEKNQEGISLKTRVSKGYGQLKKKLLSFQEEIKL